MKRQERISETGTGHAPAGKPAEEYPSVELPITGEIDLHTFQPQDLGQLIPCYLEACLARGIHEVRIIHGKGTGTLQATVHALLRRSTIVISFRSGDEHSGGWGATIATLQRKNDAFLSKLSTEIGTIRPK